MHTFYLFLILLVATHEIQATIYTVTNTALSTPGGVRFRDQIGEQYTIQTLDSASQFIWTILQENNQADRKLVQNVSLFVDPNATGVVAYTTKITHEIHVSASYISSYKGDVKNEITGVLYHEMTHVRQWHGHGEAPTGLTEGIADYVRLKANLAAGYWVKAGEGDRWDEGYDVTARFLDYCDGLRNGFVGELNKMMRSGYSDQFFLQLLGKTVVQLFAEYKAHYGN
ncbi:unnamed protein product [Lathyrus oleraceus]